ncbi:response regulator transcription factor [Propioniferax innocua]|uniref:LuxR family two component transcriptional regulator n=1 Tax=Propioniferax innocua TaxID=1753 RepID=A0A542ZCJ1_9ACTN|nr:response regulator [Propioniferax innocua]TQL58028.1 LuxR family two component transcriptional regulator [Propioniferax innocua]
MSGVNVVSGVSGMSGVSGISGVNGAEQVPAARLYVVDDDAAVCESVSWLLASVGVETTIFHSGGEFLEHYQGDHPACVILDVRMPQMSGTRLQQELAAFAPHVAIIFVSAHGDIKMSVRSMQRGAIDFLEKPYEPQYLLDVAQVGLDKARTMYIEHVQREELQRRLDTLTPREREILTLVVQGLPSQNVARRLGMSVKTVDVHRTRIKSKTDADSINTLVRDILLYRPKGFFS